MYNIYHLNNNSGGFLAYCPCEYQQYNLRGREKGSTPYLLPASINFFNNI
ncbi:hypothetical protein MmTuc01_3446 [Methanosarcina mazei Tuc01]|uniref:Uncharacterized protein n=1 Tax=Methanosarcina mazei Tuc01 TaxID=1236903 RepID=M1Q8J9_METMZ|nr:hypothetical protein MmTuc01_3446 [Methanosarcina mazei Tuc01]